MPVDTTDQGLTKQIRKENKLLIKLRATHRARATFNLMTYETFLRRSTVAELLPLILLLPNKERLSSHATEGQQCSGRIV